MVDTLSLVPHRVLSRHVVSVHALCNSFNHAILQAVSVQELRPSALPQAGNFTQHLPKSVLHISWRTAKPPCRQLIN